MGLPSAITFLAKQLSTKLSPELTKALAFLQSAEDVGLAQGSQFGSSQTAPGEGGLDVPVGGPGATPPSQPSRAGKAIGEGLKAAAAPREGAPFDRNIPELPQLQTAGLPPLERKRNSVVDSIISNAIGRRATSLKQSRLRRGF